MRRIITVLIIAVLFVGIFPIVGVSADTPTGGTSSKTSTSTSSNSTSYSSSNTATGGSTVTTTTVTEPSGTVSAKVKVAVPKSFSAKESLNGVTLSWKTNKKVKGYVISRSTDKEKWTFLTTVTNNQTSRYIDTTPSENVLYYYSIKAYKTKNGSNYFSAQSTAIPVFFGLNLYASSFKDSVRLNWDKVDEATGYEVYFSTDAVNFKRVKRFNKNTRVKYTKKGLTPYKSKYYFYIKVFKRVNNQISYIYQSDVINSFDVESVINGSVGTSLGSYKTTNVQGKKPSSYKSSISSDDKKIFYTFELEHYTDDMSPCDRIYNTFMFIHKKVTYASGGLWSKIGGSTYADAIFNKRLGQCAQYNGAMVEYLCYLGINAKLIMGYRGYSDSDKWQHFWGEARLKNGKLYVVETGNYGNDGSWYYFFTPYKQTKKYLKCGKYKSGIR